MFRSVIFSAIVVIISCTLVPKAKISQHVIPFDVSNSPVNQRFFSAPHNFGNKKRKKKNIHSKALRLVITRTHCNPLLMGGLSIYAMAWLDSFQGGMYTHAMCIEPSLLCVPNSCSFV